MAERADGAGGEPGGVDVTVPHSARIWNYWLGGEDNFEVDRVAGDEFLAIYPEQREKAQACRRFLLRAVRYLVRGGRDPSVPRHRHRPAQRRQHPRGGAARARPNPDRLRRQRSARPRARPSPAHQLRRRAITSYLDADLHDPESILVAAGATLDFDQPIALLMIGVLGHVQDYDDARVIVRRLLDGLPPGSYLVQCDGDDSSPEYLAAIEQYRDSGGVPYNVRTPEQIAGYFAGLEVIEPGVGPIAWWRPDLDERTELIDVAERGGVARKQ